MKVNVKIYFPLPNKPTVSISHRENGSRLGKSSTQVGGEGDCTGDVVVPRKGIDPLAKFESLLMAANETMRVPNP